MSYKDQDDILITLFLSIYYENTIKLLTEL